METALAHAEAARERLESALKAAEAALFTTVTDAARIDADRDEASARVEKARARCRQLRAALSDPSLSRAITRSRDRVEPPVARPEKPAPVPPVATSLPSPAPAPAASRPAPQRPGLLRRIGRLVAGSPLLRQTIGLAALVIAYLQYYCCDVQLQIASLPVNVLPL